MTLSKKAPIGKRVILYCFLFTAIILAISSPYDCYAKTDDDSRHILTSRVSDLVPIDVENGVNNVEFWGMQTHYAVAEGEKEFANGQVSYTQLFHSPGLIIEGDGFNGSSYVLAMPWFFPLQFFGLGPVIDPDESVGEAIVEDIPCSCTDAVQTAMFFQGALEGHRQTFLVIATRISDTDQWFVPQPVKIKIYAFLGGSPASYGPQMSTGPSFSEIDKFVTIKAYCSTDDAMSLELPIEFTNAQRLKLRTSIKIFEPDQNSDYCP